MSCLHMICLKYSIILWISCEYISCVNVHVLYSYRLSLEVILCFLVVLTLCLIVKIYSTIPKLQNYNDGLDHLFSVWYFMYEYWNIAGIKEISRDLNNKGWFASTCLYIIIMFVGFLQSLCCIFLCILVYGWKKLSQNVYQNENSKVFRKSDANVEMYTMKREANV